MSYSWSFISSKEVAYLRIRIYKDFKTYLCETSDSIVGISGNIYAYKFEFNNKFYCFDEKDKYYNDLCFELALELFEKNIDLKEDEVNAIYEKQKYKIMNYLFLIFTKKIERKLKKDEGKEN